MGKLRDWWQGLTEPKISKQEHRLALAKAIDTHLDTRARLPKGRYVPIHDSVDIRGIGYRRPFSGITIGTLRLMALKSGWVRAAINARKRDVANAEWGIVPDLDNEKRELENIEKLYRYALTFDDTSRIEAYDPKSLDSDLWRNLKAALDGEKNETQIKYKCARIYDLLTAEASAHAAVVQRLFDNPNRTKESFAHIQQKLVEDILVLDAGCLQKVRAVRGKTPKPLVEMYTIDGATIRPRMLSNGLPDDPAYVQVVENEQPQAYFAYEDLIYIRFNPSTDINRLGYGLSPLESLIMDITMDLNLDRRANDEISKDHHPGGLYLGSGVSREDGEDFRMYWEDEIQGRNVMPIFWSTSPDAKPPSYINIRSTDWRASQRIEFYWYLAKKVAAIFDISLIKLGITDDANRANTEGQERLNEDRGLRPLLSCLASYFTTEIVSEAGFTDIKFDYTQESMRNELAEAQTADIEIQNGSLLVNEYREEKGRTPTEYGNKPLWEIQQQAAMGDEEEEDLEGEEPEDQSGAKVIPMNKAIRADHDAAELGKAIVKAIDNSRKDDMSFPDEIEISI